jgi:hypothetical protein
LAESLTICYEGSDVGVYGWKASLSVIASGGTLGSIKRRGVNIFCLIARFHCTLWYCLLRRGRRYSTTLLRRCQGGLLLSLQSSADWDTIKLRWVRWRKCWRGVHVLHLGQKVGQEYIPRADFPVGHLSGNSSPQSLADYRSSFSLDPEVHNLWKCLTPSRILPRCVC